MTSLKMWYLPPTLLLLLVIGPTAPEVVNSMSDCRGFLLEEKPPTIPGVLENGELKGEGRYKIICQTFGEEEPEEKNRRFLTLYDTTNKIPVFSAYKYREGEGGTKRPSWMIEPQVPTLCLSHCDTQSWVLC